MSADVTFLFGPRSTRGVILGLNLARLGAVALGIGSTVVVLVATGSIPAAMVVAALAAIWVWLPMASRSPADWAPVAARHLWSMVAGGQVWTAEPTGAVVNLGAAGADLAPSPFHPRGRLRRFADDIVRRADHLGGTADHRARSRAMARLEQPWLEAATGEDRARALALEAAETDARLGSEATQLAYHRALEAAARSTTARKQIEDRQRAARWAWAADDRARLRRSYRQPSGSPLSQADDRRHRAPPTHVQGTSPPIGETTTGQSGRSGASAAEAGEPAHQLTDGLLRAAVTTDETDGAEPTTGSPTGTVWSSRHRPPVPTPDRPQVHRAMRLPPEWGAPGRWMDVMADGRMVGLVDHRAMAARTITMALLVHGKPLSLLSRAEQCSRANSWGRVLASLAYDGSCISRIQVTERAAPDVGQGQRDWLERTARDHDTDVRAVYETALDMTGRICAAHSVTLSIQCKIRGTDQATGIRDALGELEAVTANLRSAGFAPTVLSAAQLAAAVRATIDPPSAAKLALLAGPTEAIAAPVAGSGPMARKAGWSCVQTDDAWHAVFVINQYPRQEVYADWLRSLMLKTVPGAIRTVSFTLEPVAPEAARRAAESEVMGQEDSADQKSKMGFRVTAAARRQAAIASVREDELTQGHQLVTFGGLVGVTAASREQLEVAVRQVDAAAGQSYVDLRRLYGQQAEALVGLTPLARFRTKRRWE